MLGQAVIPASRESLLQAHDAELRAEAELADASEVHRIGPLWLGRYARRGFISYRDLGGLDGPALDRLIAAAVAHFVAIPDVDRFEWKTRGHDAPSDLAERLAKAGFVADDPETVMVGEAALLAGEITLPAGVRVRRAGDGADLAADVVAVGALHREVFGPDSPEQDEQLLAQLRDPDSAVELWLAEVDGAVVCAGRLDLVRGTRFAGLFGGATRADQRHRGIYRGLTAARAGSALGRGASLIYAECTEFSRPILERHGLVAVTTTTPWNWRRNA